MPLLSMRFSMRRMMAAIGIIAAGLGCLRYSPSLGDNVWFAGCIVLVTSLALIMLFCHNSAPGFYLAAGGLVGGLAGVLAGPLSMAMWMALEHYLNGSEFLGLEFLFAPLLGGVFGIFEGTAISAVWVFIARRPRRMTIGRLMLVVAIMGPMVAFLAVFPWRWLVLLTLTLAMILVPVMTALSAAIEMRQEKQSRIDPTSRLETTRRNQGGQISDLIVRFSDWDDTDLAKIAFRRKA